MIYFLNFAYFHDLNYDFVLGWHHATVDSPSHPANQFELGRCFPWFTGFIHPR